MDDLGKGTLLANLEGCARAHLMSLHHAQADLTGTLDRVWPPLGCRYSHYIGTVLPPRLYGTYSLLIHKNFWIGKKGPLFLAAKIAAA